MVFLIFSFTFPIIYKTISDLKPIGFTDKARFETIEDVNDDCTYGIIKDIYYTIIIFKST